MYQIAQNRFNEGVSKDVSPLMQKESSALHLKNIQLFTRENQSWVATTLRGTKREFTLPVNRLVIASKTYGNVLYLALAEVLNGVPTGKGELGSFPSPDPSSNQMVPLYAPFMNYGGDQNTYPLKNGPFVSSLFNFPVNKNVDMIIQPSYDGSVNMILTDGVNPMRIINSGFSTVNGSTYEIVVRDAGNEENKYNALDFENRMNLNLYTRTIAKVNFLGVFSGGQVKGGNYRYYFKYSTADGNETFFFGQSGLVQVFHGYAPSSIRGAKGDGEDTDKQVRFHLTRLDENYSFVNVYMVFASGENSTVETVYKMNNRIAIRNGEVYFTHSGFETLDRQDPSVLQDIYGSIDTADCLTEIQGYLIAGGIKQKAYDRKLLKDFGQSIRLFHDTKEMEAGLGNIVSSQDTKVSDSRVKDFFSMGYYNPLNAYHGVGYWGSEAVPFGFRLILNNGELSDVYPTLGCDNISGTFNESSYTGQNAVSIEQNHNGFDSTTGFNTLGIYRFPNRSVTGLYNGETDTIKVNGIKFIIPAIPAKILELAKGIVFVRANRKRNILQQGLIMDTIKLPIDDRYNFDDKDSGTRKLATYDDFDTLYKVVPAPGIKLEASFVINKGKFSAGNPGIHYASFADNYKKYRQGGGYQDSFAFVCGENFSDREKAMAEFARKNCALKLLEGISFLHTVKTARGSSYVNGDGGTVVTDHFSVLVPKNSRSLSHLNTLLARGTYVMGDINAPVGEDSFASSCFFMEHHFADGYVGIFPINFDDYIGFRLTGAERFSIGIPSGKSQRMNLLANRFNKVEEMAYLVNVYSEGGIWDSNTLKQNYLSLGDLEYFEISERMSWDDLASKQDVTGAITIFGGDCFVNPSFRRLYRNRFEKTEVIYENVSRDSIKEANIGMTFAWVAEHNFNTSLRVPLNDNINSAEPTSFAPYAKDLTLATDRSGSNSWRKSRVSETIGLNHGYKMLDSENFGIIADFERPFSNNDWYSRLMNSAKHIPNSFLNGYRQWGFDLQDYDASKGRITKLVPFGNDLLMIQENGISVIPVNQRMESAKDSAGPVFVESNEVLSPYQGYKSQNLGSQHPDSILATESAIYGYDAKRFTWWQLNLSGHLKSISDLNIGSELIKKAKPFEKSSFDKNSINIVAGWDPASKEIFLSFFDLRSNKMFTLGYSELAQIHTGEKDYHAKSFLSVNHAFYGISILRPRFVYRHDAEGEPRLNIYGEQRNALIRFVVNKQQEANKVFDFIEIVSNNVLPKKVTYWVQGASAVQVVVNNPQDIILSNAKYREEKAVINIPRINWKTDQSVSQYLGVQEDNAAPQIFEGARVRGKVMVVELEYDSSKLVEISSVLTYFRNSIR
jgi:hypothetical protein